ncbi:MAG: calcium/sodium antiporter [Chloroflexi bacterium]|nr:calcium/sodium antiporter [Chloroflexota bacterium]
MFLDLVILIVGVAILLAGAYTLLRGATTLAVFLGISPVVIGATVVAFGTSAPELVVTIASGLRGVSDLGLGTVVGSNIANVFLVLGLTALVSPISVHQRLIRWEVPVLLAATLMVVLFALGGGLNRIEGIIMLSGLGAFLVISPRLFPEILEETEAEVGDAPATVTRKYFLLAILFVVVGLSGLTLGSEMVVRSASAMAASVGVSTFLIGVIIIAVGTSLPEVVTSMFAAYRGEHDIAVGNIVGSNIFNLLGVAGPGAIVSGIAVNESLYRFELPVMVLSSLILLPLIWPRPRIGRYAGIALIAGYVVIVTVTVLRG